MLRGAPRARPPHTARLPQLMRLHRVARPLSVSTAPPRPASRMPSPVAAPRFPVAAPRSHAYGAKESSSSSRDLPLRLSRPYATSPFPSSLPSAATIAKDLVNSTLAQKVIYYAKLGWAALKQLYYNTKEANKINRRIKAHEAVSRREYRFLRENRSDIVRAIPFVLVWKVPLLGKAVTVLVVWKAPWMLPSVFNFLKPDQTWRQRLEHHKVYQKYIKSRLPRERDTVLDESSLGKKPTLPLDAEEAHRVVSHFAPYLDLDMLSNGQLSAVCNAVDLNGWGTNRMLKDRLWRYFSEDLPKDDEMIIREGVTSLTDEELEEASKERGLCLHENLEPADLRAQLSEWLAFAKRFPAERLPLLIYQHAYHHHTSGPGLWLSPPGASHKSLS